MMKVASGGLSSSRGTMSNNLTPATMEAVFLAIEHCLPSGNLRSSYGIDCGCGQLHVCQVALARGALGMIGVDFPFVISGLRELYKEHDRVLLMAHDVETLQYVDDDTVKRAFEGISFMVCVIGMLTPTMQILRAFFVSSADVLAFMIPTNRSEYKVLYTYICDQQQCWWGLLKVKLSGSSETRRICVVSKHRPSEGLGVWLERLKKWGCY